MPCSFAALPNELVLHVAQYLDDYDLACLLCCNHWTLDLLEPVLVMRGSIISPANSCVEWAVSSSHINFVELFLASGIHPDRGTDDEKSWSPLYLAVDKKDLPIAKLLLTHGADPNRVVLHDNGIGDTALHLATLHKDIKMIRLLAKHRADMSRKTIPGDHACTPLHYALFGGDRITVIALQRLGENKQDIDDLSEPTTKLLDWVSWYRDRHYIKDSDMMIDIVEQQLIAESEMWDRDGWGVGEDLAFSGFQIGLGKYNEGDRARQSSYVLGGGAPGNVTRALG